ncbi:MAG: hypothetical protein AAF348_01310 [Bacteroidota bacterium]
MKSKLDGTPYKRLHILMGEWTLISPQRNITTEQSAGILKNPLTAHHTKS